jgi:hypothetical protein
LEDRTRTTIQLPLTSNSIAEDPSSLGKVMPRVWPIHGLAKAEFPESVMFPVRLSVRTTLPTQNLPPSPEAKNIGLHSIQLVTSSPPNSTKQGKSKKALTRRQYRVPHSTPTNRRCFSEVVRHLHEENCAEESKDCLDVRSTQFLSRPLVPVLTISKMIHRQTVPGSS